MQQPIKMTPVALTVDGIAEDRPHRLFSNTSTPQIVTRMHFMLDYCLTAKTMKPVRTLVGFVSISVPITIIKLYETNIKN